MHVMPYVCHVLEMNHPDLVEVRRKLVSPRAVRASANRSSIQSRPCKRAIT